MQLLPQRAFPTGLLAVLSVVLLFSSCFSVRPSGTRSGSKVFETFYIGELGTQYFIKPLRFRHGKEELKADFTFRYLDGIRDSVTVNVSMYRPSILRQMDSLSFQVGPRGTVIHQPALLFTEKQGKFFHTRFSGRMALQDLYDLFMEPGEWRVIPWHSGRSDAYQPTRRGGKALRSLKNNLFVLF